MRLQDLTEPKAKNPNKITVYLPLEKRIYIEGKEDVLTVGVSNGSILLTFGNGTTSILHGFPYEFNTDSINGKGSV